MILIFVGASELNVVDGNVMLGRDTVAGCEIAISLQSKLHRAHSTTTVAVVATAGNTVVSPHGEQYVSTTRKVLCYLTRKPMPAPEDGIKVHMAGLMTDYIRAHSRVLKPQINAVCAEEFTTSGEMEALSDYCSRQWVDELHLVVKSSQARRMKLLCRHWMKEYGQEYIAGLYLHTYPPAEPLKWVVYEPLALTKDIYSMTRRRHRRKVLMRQKFSTT